MSAAPPERAERLAEAVRDAELDALLVGDLVNPGDSGPEAMADVRWLTGFSGTSGLTLVGPERRDFVTDSRYVDRVRDDLPAGFELIESNQQLVDALSPHLNGRIGFDPRATSVHMLARIEEALAEGGELLEAKGLVEPLRRVKDAAEIEAIAASAALTDSVLAELEQAGFAGRREREVAVWIEGRMRELGASAPSFPPIVASGPNGASPHAEPSEREIEEGELVTVDCGAILDGYCSDCTRTYATGQIAGAPAEAYELVRRAQQAGLEAVRAGANGKAVDAVARDIVAEGGHGDHFRHGLGHGVGIAVHEPPRLSPRSEDDLLAGDVVSVEPGVYVPGEYGIRIEDLVVVEEGGVRNLCSRPKELQITG